MRRHGAHSALEAGLFRNGVWVRRHHIAGRFPANFEALQRLGDGLHRHLLLDAEAQSQVSPPEQIPLRDHPGQAPPLIDHRHRLYTSPQ